MSGRNDRETRFDEELRRTARSLVAEPLPRGVLDSSLDEVRSRRAVPGFAPAAVAILILLVATALTLGPGSFGGPQPAPTASPAASPTASPTPATELFRTSAAIRADFERLGWSCRAGEPLSSIGPGPNAVVRESVVCLPPDSVVEYMAAVIVGETAAGKVVDVHVKANIVGDDTAATREAIAIAFAKAAAIGSAIPTAGNELGQWVQATLLTLKPSGSAAKAIRGFGLKLFRDETGGYQLSVQPAAP
jgi:hypothetical protein